jgi:putative membrane protein
MQFRLVYAQGGITMKNRSILTLSLIVFLSAFGLSACNRSDRVEAAREPDTAADNRNVLTDDERDFVVYASEMHNGEIAMAEQAKHKSTNADVRSYADSVIKSHSDALKSLWHNLGSTSKEASWDTRSHMDTLGGLSGTPFDQEFIVLMIADHQSASDTFREEINATQNKNLKDYLQQALPGLEKSLRNGRDMQSKLTGQATTN